MFWYCKWKYNYICVCLMDQSVKKKLRTRSKKGELCRLGFVNKFFCRIVIATVATHSFLQENVFISPELCLLTMYWICIIIIKIISYKIIILYLKASPAVSVTTKDNVSWSEWTILAYVSNKALAIWTDALRSYSFVTTEVTSNETPSLLCLNFITTIHLNFMCQYMKYIFLFFNVIIIINVACTTNENKGKRLSVSHVKNYLLEQITYWATWWAQSDTKADFLTPRVWRGRMKTCCSSAVFQSLHI